ncbi:MAG: fibronectin type III domain-containing protein [Actinomycetes bacterium]
MAHNSPAISVSPARVLTVVTAALLGILSLLIAPAAAQAVTHPAPGKPQLARVAGADSILVTWRTAKGASRYKIAVFNGKVERVYSAAATATSLTAPGSGSCARYSVTVTAIYADGSKKAAAAVRLASLGPAGVTGLAGQRTGDQSTGQVSWGAPNNTGGAPTGYHVIARSLTNGTTALDQVVPNLTAQLTGLDPAQSYAVKVTAENAVGGCITGTVVLGNQKPSPPVKVAALRAADTPSHVDVTWHAPFWAGVGDHVVYRVGYGTGSALTWVTVDGLSTQLTLDPAHDWNIAVRAVNGSNVGAPANQRLQVNPLPGEAVMDPAITIDTVGQDVSVAFSSFVGSDVLFPNMQVDVTPTLDPSGFSESHLVHNGATQVIFSSVPCGTYTVTATGVGTDTTREFGRKVVNLCGTGYVGANSWRIVRGSPTITGTDITVPAGGAYDMWAVSTLPRTSQDMVLSTQATLTSGYGYGVWARASVNQYGVISGYSMQYDPGYATVDAKFGKALLLRLWTNSNECGNPLARVKMPDSLAVSAPHQYTVVLKGDTLYAQVDGITLFNVPSLAQAIHDSGCPASFTVPNGTQVGFRTWNTSTAATFHNTQVN